MIIKFNDKHLIKTGRLVDPTEHEPVRWSISHRWISRYKQSAASTGTIVKKIKGKSGDPAAWGCRGFRPEWMAVQNAFSADRRVGNVARGCFTRRAVWCRQKKYSCLLESGSNYDRLPLFLSPCPRSRRNMGCFWNTSYISIHQSSF